MSIQLCHFKKNYCRCINIIPDMKLATTTRNKIGWIGDKSIATRNTLPFEVVARQQAPAKKEYLVNMEQINMNYIILFTRTFFLFIYHDFASFYLSVLCYRTLLEWVNLTFLNHILLNDFYHDTRPNQTNIQQSFF